MLFVLFMDALGTTGLSEKEWERRGWVCKEDGAIDTRSTHDRIYPDHGSNSSDNGK